MHRWFLVLFLNSYSRDSSGAKALEALAGHSRKRITGFKKCNCSAGWLCLLLWMTQPFAWHGSRHRPIHKNYQLSHSPLCNETKEFLAGVVYSTRNSKRFQSQPIQLRGCDVFTKDRTRWFATGPALLCPEPNH